MDSPFSIIVSVPRREGVRCADFCMHRLSYCLEEHPGAICQTAVYVAGARAAYLHFAEDRTGVANICMKLSNQYAIICRRTPLFVDDV